MTSLPEPPSGGKPLCSNFYPKIKSVTLNATPTLGAWWGTNSPKHTIFAEPQVFRTAGAQVTLLFTVKVNLANQWRGMSLVA
jgi:hypothetical protein